MKRKVTAPKSQLLKAWTGKIARLRVFDQPTGNGRKVLAYISPGNNSDYIGESDDPNVIHVLFLARGNARPIQGYTNNSGKIEWLDY